MATSRTITIAAAAALALGAIAAQPVRAACTWQWDCSYGQCRQVPLCDNALDIPGPRTPSVRPIVPPSIRPIRPPMLPPVGTSSCSPRYVCDDDGICRWRDVCR